MKSLWETAVALTGIAGVGAFVLYALYKQWLNLPLLKKLKPEQIFLLSKQFLYLTFGFAIAALILSGFQTSVSHSSREVSSQELAKLLTTRYATGEGVFRDLEKRPDIAPEARQRIIEIHHDYTEKTKASLEAIKSGDEVLNHELTRQIFILLASDNAVAAIPNQERKELIFTATVRDTDLENLNTGPSAPSALSATAISDSRIDLKWANNANYKTGLSIERSLSNGNAFAQIVIVMPQVVSFEDTGLKQGTTYYYRVHEMNALGTLAYSNQATATTLVPQPAAAAKAINPPPAGEMVDAASGTTTLPFLLVDGAISQSVDSMDLSGGKAEYLFNITTKGEYAVLALVDAPSVGHNSFFVNADAMPLSPDSVWDIQPTTGFERRICSWRGKGSETEPEFRQKYFAMEPGIHKVFVYGRQSGTRLQKIMLVKRPGTPVLNTPIGVP